MIKKPHAQNDLKNFIYQFFCPFFEVTVSRYKIEHKLYSHIYTTLYRVIKHTRKSITHDNVIGQDESQWEVVLVAAGVVQVLHNFDRTLTALVASGNVDWRFICFPVGFQAFETCWVVIQSRR